MQQNIYWSFTSENYDGAVEESYHSIDGKATAEIRVWVCILKKTKQNNGSNMFRFNLF